MNRHPEFYRITEKIYKLIIEKSKELEKKGGTPPTTYDIKISKDLFSEREWKFMTENENKFKFSIDWGGKIKTYNVYKIEDNHLCSNETNVFGIATNYVD
ncbi:hypothetical protein SAMN05421847_1297 [Halpernia humi]|uniref:Uncharacterized protein n=1 Tax=Halpernia humi TaxID=493375 RepID=A0A1H5WR09_9FLAO|nr:hypothetical protein [Halpernia humi]SEG01626.1 hypothetical protein SAMN05421847_1297 [Halpernia humi]